VFKLVTAVAALRSDAHNAERVYTCQLMPDRRIGNVVRGAVVHDDVTDTRPHGAIAMKAGIAESCNAYFAQLAVDVGPEALFETAKQLGIRVATPNTSERLARRLLQAGYGQGEIVVTPLQVATVAAAIANRCRIPDVHLTET